MTIPSETYKVPPGMLGKTVGNGCSTPPGTLGKVAREPFVFKIVSKTGIVRLEVPRDIKMDDADDIREWLQIVMRSVDRFALQNEKGST